MCSSSSEDESAGEREEESAVSTEAAHNVETSEAESSLETGEVKEKCIMQWSVCSYGPPLSSTFPSYSH